MIWKGAALTAGFVLYAYGVMVTASAFVHAITLLKGLVK